MDLAQEQILNSAIRQSGSGSTARFQSKGRKASAWAGGLATAASLAAASAVGSDPLVFTPDEYSVGNVGQPDQYVDIVLANGTVVRLPAGHYVISPEGLLVPLIDGTDDPDGDGLTNGQEDTNGNGNWFDDDADGDLVPNFLDSLVPPSDTNEDGLADTLEDPDGSGSVLDDDTDGDNIPNYADDEKLVPNSISSNLVAYELPDLEEAGFSFGGYWSLGALSFAGASAAAVVINEISRPTFDDVEVTYISEDAPDDTGPDTTSGSTVWPAPSKWSNRNVRIGFGFKRRHADHLQYAELPGQTIASRVSPTATNLIHARALPMLANARGAALHDRPPRPTRAI